MADKAPGFKARWMARLEGWLQRSSNDVTNAPNASMFRQDPKFIRSRLEGVLKNAADSIGLSPDDRSKLLEHVFNNRGYADIDQSSRWFRDRYLKLIEIRDQESWADWKTNFRYLLFRALTALAIAGTVLLTGWLAKCWEIPLPLLRIIP